MNADTGAKVNPGHQRKIKGHIGTLKRKRKKEKGTTKKITSVIFFQNHFQLGIIIGIKYLWNQVSHKIVFTHGIVFLYSASWFSKHCYKYFI